MRFNKKIQTIIGFAIGVLTTIIIGSVIFIHLKSPIILTGLSDNTSDDVILYKMLPNISFLSSVEVNWEEGYPIIGESFLGEYKILPDPPGRLSVHKTFAPCDGSGFDINISNALYTLLSEMINVSGETYSLSEFSILDLPKHSTYMSRSGSFPMRGGGGNANNIVIEKIVYVPCEASFLQYYSGDLQTGEILLVKTDDYSKLNFIVIPCNGQTVTAAEYPEFAAALFPSSDNYTVPDLTGTSPIKGAQFCITVRGKYPFHDYEVLPSDKMRCKECDKVVPFGKYCSECGAKNN